VHSLDVLIWAVRRAPAWNSTNPSDVWQPSVAVSALCRISQVPGKPVRGVDVIMRGRGSRIGERLPTVTSDVYSVSSCTTDVPTRLPSSLRLSLRHDLDDNIKGKYYALAVTEADHLHHRCIDRIVVRLKPNTHRRRRRDSTVELWTHPSAVVAQFTISCVLLNCWGRWQVTT